MGDSQAVQLDERYLLVPTMISKAPGRICLFGDHQDYLELPVIACAINRYITIHGTPNGIDSFVINLPDLGEKEVIPTYLSDDRKNLKPTKGAHLKTVLCVVQNYGCTPNQGYDITIEGDIPINAGLSSSSAMVVAWVQWLFTTFGCNQQITPEFIGKVAFEAEVTAQNSPGGKMDQYTSAIGDMIYLETDTESKHQKIETSLEGLIIGESGISKDTVGVLGDIKGKSLEAIATIQKEIPEFELPAATLDSYEKYKSLVPIDLQPFFYAAIQNHLITQKAVFALSEKKMNYTHIGKLLNDHHDVLKNTLHITVPVIDAMIDAALETGAYGAKIVGSGGGGCICALAPLEKQNAVIQAIKDAGAKDAYRVDISKGAYIL